MAEEIKRGDAEGANILESTFSWLKNPNLLENLVHDLGRCGVVGEPGNLVTLILVYNSRLCEHPLNLSASGESGIGKSYLACQVSDLWPDCTVISGYMSRTSLIHDTDWAKKVGDRKYVVDLSGKVLVILEAESNREFLDLMKPIRSHDKREISFAITEGEGKHRVKKVTIRGWPVFVTISVNPFDKPEDSTRDLNLTLAYSEGKGRAVNLEKGRKRETPWKYPTDKEVSELKSNWANALYHLKSYKVINPFATKLAEIVNSKYPRSMRDFDKLCSLFDSSALLHQYQRVRIRTKGGEEFIVGTFDDLRITLKVASILLESTTTGLRADVLQAYREFFKMVCPSGNGKTLKELMEEWPKHFGVPIKRTTLLENYLYPLRDAGLLNQDDSERAHRWEVSSVELSGSVETDPTVLLKGYDLEAGLRSQLSDLFERVGVSEVSRGESPISTASIENVIQEILASVQTTTIRQSFIDKLGDPLASCLKNEEKVSVGGHPTHSDSSDTSPTHHTNGDLAAKVAKVRQMFGAGCSLEEMERAVGLDILEHCFQKGYIPRVGGRSE